MEAMENNAVVEAAEEIVVASSNGVLKKLGIVGGLAALGVAGYFVVKKIKAKKNEAAAVKSEAYDEDDVFKDADIEVED